jgi:hypothetical protein
MCNSIQGRENGEVAKIYGLGPTLETMLDWLKKAKIIAESV